MVIRIRNRQGGGLRFSSDIKRVLFLTDCPLMILNGESM